MHKFLRAFIYHNVDLIDQFISIDVPAKVNFVEMPSDTSVPIGTEATLKCVTSSRVEKCTWTWKSLHGNEPEIVAQEYPSNGDLGRDCSLTLPRVYAEKQGQWACQVSISSLNTMLTSPFVKLIVYEQGIFIFVNVLLASTFYHFHNFFHLLSF